MSTSVILDGPGAGMTENEYEEMRHYDGQIWIAMGHRPFDDQRCLWDASSEDGALRDEPGGVPYFHADMNGAYKVLDHALRNWRYAARQIFFGQLQKLASFAGDTEVGWPEVLTSLLDELPINICTAYLRTIAWAEANNFPLIDAPEEVQSWCEKNIGIEMVERLQDDGTTRSYPQAKLTGEAPWVHN
jgi:hypothetical protein